MKIRLLFATIVLFSLALTASAQNGGKIFFSVKLDDPSFASPIYANLVEGEDGVHSLIWSRRSAD